VFTVENPHKTRYLPAENPRRWPLFRKNYTQAFLFSQVAGFRWASAVIANGEAFQSLAAGL